jgi:hypothetical protein
VKLLLDEIYPATVADQLRARGHDIVSIHDADHRWLEGAADDEVFAAAVAEDQVLVTENVPDDRRLEADALAKGESVPTFVFTKNRQFPRGDPATIGRLIRALGAFIREEPARTTFLKPTT